MTSTIQQPIVLIPSQNIALEELLNWTKGTELFHTLTGSAGTGKTTVLKQYIDGSPYRSSTAITAPTHKAKKVAAKSTKLQAITIQALLGLRPNTDLDNFDINKPQFDPMAETQIQNYRVVIVDEASMLNQDLHELLCSEATRTKTKVLFVGDELQLPPVNESMSQALTEHETSRLVEVIRQKDTNPLMNLLNALRNDIVNGTETFFTILKEQPIDLVGGEIFEDAEGYAILNLPDWIARMSKTYDSAEFRGDSNYCRTVAWTNVKVTEHNQLIRKSLFMTDQPIIQGDLMMAYSTVNNQYNENLIINSEDYNIKNVALTENQHKLRVFRVNATMVDVPILTTFDVLHPDSQIAFLGTERKLLNIAKVKKGRAWIDYYKFKNQHLLLEPIMNGRTLVCKKDIDYGYAITVHKTQGSTYNTVFVDLPNILKNFDTIERKKLVYVALSRASNKVFILNPN